jgi:hypothetical protein
VPPVQIDGFDELRPIGRGGFSFVFSARQRDFNRRVAVKVLAFGLADERERRSFERECRAMGLVSQHPHIVTVFNAAFTTTKQPCIVMELYSGGTLGERLKREGPLPLALVLDVGVKIAGALQTAHDRGLLHRDIKPQNLFVSEFGEPALGDFGISTLDDERSISGGGGLTVHYAPPEVLEGAAATARSDVYSFAATLYTLLEGTRPFVAPEGTKQSVGDLARRIVLEDPPRVRRRDAPRSLAALLAGAMAKRPEQRPSSAGELGAALQQVQAELGLPVTALPVATAAAAPAVTEQRWPGPAAPQPPAHDDDHGHTVTVARGAPAAPPEPLPAPPEASNRRVVIGTVAGVVALLLVAGAVLLFGGGDGNGDDDDPPLTAPGTTQLLDFDPPAPQGVTVVAGEQPTQVVVSWQAVGEPGDGTEYQVRPQTGDASPVNTEELQAVFEIAEGDSACYTVVAISPDGRLSDPSPLACL